VLNNDAELHPHAFIEIRLHNGPDEYHRLILQGDEPIWALIICLKAIQATYAPKDHKSSA
jgi:hypothetical protein